MMSSAPVVCIVCQSEIDTPVINPCTKGHYQCQLCTVKLNGFCRICAMPCDVQTNSAPIGTETFIEVVPTTVPMYTYSDVEDVWNADGNNISSVVIEYYENMLDSVDGENLEHRERCAEENINFLSSVSSLNLNRKVEGNSPSILEILEKLQENKCSKNCSNFEHNIRQTLFEQFNFSQKSCHPNVMDYKQEHRGDCRMDLGNMEHCLSTTLKHIVVEQPINSKDVLQVISKGGRTTRIFTEKATKKESTENVLNQAQNECSLSSPTDIKDETENECSSSSSKDVMVQVENECNSFIDEDSNVVRACFRNYNNGALKPQYELVTTFPKTSNSTRYQKDFSLPFAFESNSKMACIIKCPLPECNMTIEDRYLMTHFLEKHSLHKLSTLRENECKLFYVDPSILEYNQMNCIANFTIPNICNSAEETQSEKQGLLIFIMVCKVNLSNRSSVQEKTEKLSIQENLFAEMDEIIDAEIAETIYGIRKNLQNDPVKWAHDDVLLICPMAPIPKQKAVRASMAVFRPKNPLVNISMSFCMRSLRDFATVSDIMGCPDTMFLTSVNIASLTSNGQHGIHCQIMCKF